MDTNLEETTKTSDKTSEQDPPIIVAADTRTETKEKVSAEELKISNEIQKG